MSNDYRKDFFIKFGTIAKLESSGEFSYIRRNDDEDYYFPREYAYDEEKVVALMKKSVKDNHDYVYDLTKDVPKKEYKEGYYY